MGLTLATIPLAVTNLSRMQFAVTAITHFLFVTTTIGMLLTTMIFEFMYAYGRGDTEKYGRLTLFFSRIFFFSFGTGVVTGLIMEFQFGMNWSAFTRLMGDVAGVPLAIESMISFFVESTIIGLWRFTWGKLPKRAHAWLGVGMLGASLFSIVWIIAINAFMQNPYGFRLEGDRARLTSLITLLQNPQYRPEFLHVLFAILITGGFLTAGIAAWQILHKRDTSAFKIAVQIGLLIALPAAFLQPAQGDDQGAATAALQPMKFTAIEGRYETEGSPTTGAPWAMAALINEDTHTTKAVSIPNMGTYFGKNTFTGTMPGMNAVAKMYHAKFDKTVCQVVRWPDDLLSASDPAVLDHAFDGLCGVLLHDVRVVCDDHAASAAIGNRRSSQNVADTRLGTMAAIFDLHIWLDRCGSWPISICGLWATHAVRCDFTECDRH